MDLDPVEPSQERAPSSEPGSTRPKPFDDADRSSRKRQRVNSGPKSSESGVDALSSPNATSPKDEAPDTRAIESTNQPHTPPSDPSNHIVSAPNSSKVTLNLRTNKNMDGASSSKAAPPTPSKMSSPTRMAKRLDIGSAIDVSDTSSTSSSTTLGSPKVEVVGDDEDVETEYRDDQAVNMIDDNDEVIPDIDPVLHFPHISQNEQLPSVLRRLRQYLEYEYLETEDIFIRLSDWIKSCLTAMRGSDRLWFDSYEKHTEFWKRFPMAIQALHNRKYDAHYGDWINSRNSRRRGAMVEFFARFAELTARFVSMDIRTLKEHERTMSETTPPLVSGNYLHQLSTLLDQNEGGIADTLHRVFRFDWPSEAAGIIKRLMNAGADVSTLTRLVNCQLNLRRRAPKIIEETAQPSKIVRRIVKECRRQLGSGAVTSEVAAGLIGQGYKLYMILAPCVEDVAEKHPTCLSREAAEYHLQCLYDIYYDALSLEDSPASEDIRQHSKLHPALPREAFAQVIATEWKFRMLKKFIVFGQMQVRVFGVSKMCEELLAIYNGYKYLSSGRGKDAVLQFFGDILISNKLVDYIVGTASHPELIAGSGHIVGFLAATRAYRDKETDIIWHTMATSEDPRVVEATVDMQKIVCELYEEHHLLYYCEKAMELPLIALTHKMREFITSIFLCLGNKAQHGGKPVDAQPYELCVRILRESSAVGADLPPLVRDIQIWAAKSLKNISYKGPETLTRHKIYAALLKDISDKSTTAPGSLCALFSMQAGNGVDLRELTTSHGFAGLLVEHVEFMNRQPGFIYTPNYLEARQTLLISIMMSEPKSLTAELGKRLWVALVGQGAHTFNNRQLGWVALNTVAAKCSAKNPFLQACFREYLPALDSECYHLGALEFTRMALKMWLSEATDDLLEDDSGLEQVWRMALTAPPGTIEEQAIALLVEVYVDSPCIQSMPKPRQHALHLKLVNRCLTQLSEAAKQLQADAGTEPMAISDAVPSISKDELCFTRSLIILREFLRSYQSKPQFVSQKQKPLAGSTEIQGTPKTFKYQVVDSKSHGERQTLEIGDDNTIGDLYAMIAKSVGFSNFKLYHWGLEVGVDKTIPDAPLSSVKVGNGLLLIHKQEQDFAPGSPLMNKSTTLEAEIMAHFKELWDYLGMQERLAREIYAFLVKFPVYPELRGTFDREDASWADVFPLKQPYKCSYALYALNEHIKASAARPVELAESVQTRALELITSAIIHREIVDSCDPKELRDVLALQLVECLGHILQEFTPPAYALSRNLTSALLRRLLDLLNQARLDVGVRTSVKMVLVTFDTIMDASILCRTFWNAFATDSGTVSLLQVLLLGDSRMPVRKGVMKSIKRKCHYVQGSEVSPSEICDAMWPILFGLTTMAASMISNCYETFELAFTVFSALTAAHQSSVDVENCLVEWARLLLTHESAEVVGSLKPDVAARWLSKLLEWSSGYIERYQLPLPRNTIAINLIRKHLFPPLTSEEPVALEHKPILDPTTRKQLNGTIVNLTKEDQIGYRQAMDHLSQLPMYEEHEQQTSKHEQRISLVACDLPPFNFDRLAIVRSPAVYCGLKNQSNTCYLNSLMTQLFMNPMFRQFMMNVDLQDKSKDQKLLVETSNLFAQMQNSYKRFIDPVDFIHCIKTYENEHIDPNIQMDVDEFYNLLFDRFEGQMRTPAEKRTFKSFYGGQIVQQVKSKECPHISERLEPFSAIQCDIKGKATLEESLQAYVDGEVMEGDNKYKCSTCDKHVDAVKRACLKDIPDNVIFHLKRFDFNLRTMQRSKINDYFRFPHTIDMRPYTVDHLMEPEKELPNDPFELVGILVHTGTAESGHYYSYIRERPTEDASNPKWVEFNDAETSCFDPASIENLTFGGAEFHQSTGAFQYEKSWNAYMLFYQRSSIVQAQQQGTAATQSLKAPQMPMPTHLKKAIAEENEHILRKYLLNDANHPEFILKMMENDHHVDRLLVSHDHHMESLAMTTVMAHLEHVVIRHKETPQLGAYYAAIKNRINNCTECAETFLEWLVKRPESWKQLILRCPDMNVRNDTSDLIMVAINCLRHGVSGFVIESTGYEDDEEPEEAEGACNNLFERVVQALMQVHDMFQKIPRAWPEYFGLLYKIARLGTGESVVLIENSYLRKVLEILTYDLQLSSDPQLAQMLTVVSKRPATRPVSWEAIITLCKELLKACDLSAETVNMETHRYGMDVQSDDGRIPLNTVEHTLLMQHWTRGTRNILVEKLLLYNQAPLATQEIIAMILDELEDDVAGVYNAIRFCLRNATVNNTAMCIDAALTYLKYAQTLEKAQQMYHSVAVCTQVVDHSAAREHLRFYKLADHVLRQSTYVDDKSFFSFGMLEIPTWAPSLLTHYDERTRNEAEDYLERVLFTDLSSEYGIEEEVFKAGIEAIRLLGTSIYRYLSNNYVKPRNQILRSQCENAIRIIQLCRRYYDAESEDPIDQEFLLNGTAVEASLRRLLIDEQDAELSEDAEEWEGEGSEEGFSSEVPELPEMVGPLEEADAEVDAEGEMDEIPSDELP